MTLRSTILLIAMLFMLCFANAFSQINTNNEKFKTGSQGEVIKSEMERIEAYYYDNFFSKGFKETEMSGTGYYPYYRMKWFYEQRANQSGEVPFLKRWNAYQQSRVNQLETESTLPVPQWINLGPTNNGGRMISHAFDPVDPEIVWVGSAAGGLWKTTDGGDSWQPMTDYLPSIAIGAVGIKPDDRNIMLLGTGEPFGWTYMVDGVGILRSTDRGITWEQTNLTYTQPQGVSCYEFAWDPDSTHRVYAACTNGLWLSEDAGENWNLLYPGRITSLVMKKKNPAILYIASQTEGILKSTNYGSDWTMLNNGIASGSEIGLTSLSICDSIPEVLYASIARNTLPGKLLGLYKSTDGGSTWNLIPTPDYFCYEPPNQNLCQGWYNNVAAVSPVDSALVFANGINMHKSTNGGITWTQPGGSLPLPNVHVDHHSFGFSPHDPQVIYSLNDGGVYKSTDGGENWIEKNDGLVTFQFYSISSAMTDTTIISGGSQDNCTQLLNDSTGKNQWFIWWYGDGMISNIDYTNSDILYGEQQFGLHGKSVNGGSSAIPINNGITEQGPWVTPVVMDPVDPTVLYTVSNQKIYKTTNGGRPWFDVANINNCKLLEIDQVNNDIIYAASYTFQSAASYLYRSSDGGGTWNTAVSPGWRVTDLAASPGEEGVLYATRNNFDGNARVYKSTDYGSTWMDISGDLPPVGSNAICINPEAPAHLYLATDLGIYVSLNDGNNWVEFNNNLPNVYTMDIHYHPADSTIRIGTFGRGCWKVKAINPDFPVGIENQENSIVSTFHVYQNYPNPFNPSTNIKYELNKPGQVSIDIYNQLGQKVSQLLSAYQSAGEYSINWNGKNSINQPLSSGVYFCRIAYNGLSKTIKMVLKK